MDNKDSLVPAAGCSYGFQSVLLCFEYDVLYYSMYEYELLCIIFIRGLYFVNFNVSSTKDNAHAKLSRYV